MISFIIVNTIATLLWHDVKALWRSMERQVEQSPVVQLSPTLRVCSVSSVVWTLQACKKSVMSPTSRTTVPLGNFRSSSGFPSQQPGRQMFGLCVCQFYCCIDREQYKRGMR